MAKVRAAGMRMVGPNCMGVLTAEADAPMNGSFSPIFPSSGGLALSSQSGALGMVILSLATRRHVGLSGVLQLTGRVERDGTQDPKNRWRTIITTRWQGKIFPSVQADKVTSAPATGIRHMAPRGSHAQ